MQSSERARNIAATILKGLARVGQKKVAAELDVHESTISRMKGEDIERFSKFLAALDFEVVDHTGPCEKSALIEALRPLAKIGIEHLPVRKVG